MTTPTRGHVRGNPRHPPPVGPLRLRLAPDFGRSAIDGVWWPYGRDLTREGSHLVNDFPARRGRVDRLAYAPSDWEQTANHVFTDRGRIKVGYLPASEVHVILLRLTDTQVIRLEVVHDDAAPVAPADQPANGRLRTRTPILSIRCSGLPNSSDQ